jgi:hypothetical protein
MDSSVKTIHKQEFPVHISSRLFMRVPFSIYFPCFEKKKEAHEITLLFVCLCHPNNTKAGIVEPEETAVGKHIPAATNPVKSISAGPSQHSRSWFRAPLGPITIFLFVPDFYVF